MAIFHLGNRFISRGKGQSVVAAAAYQRREKEEERQPGRSIADDWLDS